MRPLDFIVSARLLVNGSRGKPPQANLRRAMSTSYYAMFHALAKNCADTLIGGAGAAKSKHAWLEVYRSLAHGTAKAACVEKRIVLKFPADIVLFSQIFVDMQEKRHEADYNPRAKFYKSQVIADIGAVELAISNFKLVPAKDKRAFASWVIFKGLKKNS